MISRNSGRCARQQIDLLPIERLSAAIRQCWRVVIAQAVEAEIGNRQGERTDTELPQFFAEVSAGTETREIAAKKAGFGSRESYRRALGLNRTPGASASVNSTPLSLDSHCSKRAPFARHVEMACWDWNPKNQKALEPRPSCAVFSFRGEMPGAYGSGVRERESAPFPFGR